VNDGTVYRIAVSYELEIEDAQSNGDALCQATYAIPAAARAAHVSTRARYRKPPKTTAVPAEDAGSQAT
jgi:hypothetical protein